MKSTLSVFLVALCGLSISCDRPTQTTLSSDLSGMDAVASIADRRIGHGEFEAELARRARGAPEAYVDIRQREALLEEMIESEAIYLRATESGFDRTPEMARRIKRLIVSEFRQAHLNDESRLMEVAEDEVKKHYQEHSLKYATPERARFAVIYLGISSKASAESKAKISSKASEALEEARALPESEAGFGSVAQRYSEDQATRYAGGDAGWITRAEGGRWGGKVMEAVFALKDAGELGAVIEDAKGYYVVKLMERKEAEVRSFEEVKEGIRYHLAQLKRQEAQQAFSESMKAGLTIQRNKELLESIAAPTASKPQPPRIPAG